MKIYTKTGDKGKTSLYNGEKVEKNHPLIEAVGLLDLCNSTLGVALSHFEGLDPLIELKRQLTSIQAKLFEAGAAVATPRDNSREAQLNKTPFPSCHTEELENWIDEMSNELPVLTQFILPGGHPIAANLHQARTLCRSAERKLTPLLTEEKIEPQLYTYINRLSDYLFTAARSANYKLNYPEPTWNSSTK